MDSTTKNTRVSINLSDIDCNEALPDRIFSLSHPEFSIAVGRGSQSDETIEPRPDNAWFGSRVMSRQHATIRADPETRILTIQDDSSMHGTSLNGLRVGKEPLELLPADILTFGAEVVRGEETYQPLKISIHFEWADEENTQVQLDKTSVGARNKFTVDMSDEDFDSELDDDDDDDVQIVSSSIREPSVEILSSAVYKPQPSQSNIRDSQPAPGVTVASITHVAEATKNANTTSEPAKTPLDEADEDEDDDEEDSDDELTRVRVSASKRPPYHEYTAHTDDDGEELEYDSDFPDPSFFDDTDEEGMDTKANKDAPISQSAQLKGHSVLSSDGTRREPSPSDAALARPRVSDLDMTTLPQAATTSVPPPPSAQKMYPPSCSNNYYQANRYVPPLGYFDNLNRPSHSFVYPSSYGPQRTPVNPLGHINAYPTNPWNLWKSTSLGHTNQQPPPPPPPPRAMNQYGQSNNAVSEPVVFKPFSDNASMQSPQSPLASSFDSLRGQKRKADAISEYSDDESVASSSIDKSVVTDALKSSSPAMTSSSPATNLSPTSAKSDKLSTVNETVPGEDGGEVPQNNQSSNDELDQILDNLLERHEAPSFDFQDMAAMYEHAESVQEPPRKKVKGNNGESTTARSRASTALKYTVTALAGVTIGALGTVVGLASLPVDYFV